MCLLVQKPSIAGESSFSSWDEKSKTDSFVFVLLLLLMLLLSLEALGESFAVGLWCLPPTTTTAEGGGLSTSQSVDQGVRGIFWWPPSDDDDEFSS